VDYEYASVAREVDDGRGLSGEDCGAIGGGFAPVIVPKIAQNQSGLADRQLLAEADLHPLAAASECFHARAQRQVEGGVFLYGGPDDQSGGTDDCAGDQRLHCVLSLP
jgi:hypothetical protein